jgi:hypothetical protein
MLNRLPHSYGARVASTNVLSDLLDVSAEAVGTERRAVSGRGCAGQDDPLGKYVSDVGHYRSPSLNVRVENRLALCV